MNKYAQEHADRAAARESLAADVRRLAYDDRACDETRRTLEQLASDLEDVARDERNRAEIEQLY